MDAKAVVTHCTARAALAGNPSDGFGGAVVATPVPAYRATVTLTPATRFEIVHSPTADDTFTSWPDLQRHLERFGYGSMRELVLASLRAGGRALGRDLPPCTAHVATTIPRGVGLAGSSAIVVATLRGLAELLGETLPPDELASLALTVERDELGIAAGLQDRVVQSFERTMLMHFDADRLRTLPSGATAGSYTETRSPAPLRLLVAHRLADAEPSGQLHGALQHRRSTRGVPDELVGQLAGAAIAAAQAIVSGDRERLGAAMDATFDLRRRLYDVRPEHVELVEEARRHGGHANTTGSGGAIVTLPGSDDELEPLRTALVTVGAEVVDLVLG